MGIHSTINLNNETIFGPDTEIIKKINFRVTPNLEEKFFNQLKPIQTILRLTTFMLIIVGLEKKQ